MKGDPGTMPLPSTKELLVASGSPEVVKFRIRTFFQVARLFIVRPGRLWLPTHIKGPQRLRATNTHCSSFGHANKENSLILPSIYLICGTFIHWQRVSHVRPLVSPAYEWQWCGECGGQSSYSKVSLELFCDLIARDEIYSDFKFQKIPFYITWF